MDLSGQASQARFASYVEALVEVIGHADRAEPLNDYCVGLLMPGERKSVEPMAAIVAPARVSAKHQSLLHLVGQAPWSDEAVLQKIRELLLPGIERQGRIEAWIVDDTGFTKKGTPRKFPLESNRRRLDLTFKHHAEVAALSAAERMVRYRSFMVCGLNCRRA